MSTFCPRGACVVAPGGRGHAWLLREACMVAPGGHAWLLWGGMCGCSRGGMRGCSGGHMWLLLGVCAWLLWGACVVAPWGACIVAQGGHVWLLLGVCAWLLQGGHAWLLGGHMWDMTRYGDTVNEQAVHILLECILVLQASVILPTWGRGVSQHALGQTPTLGRHPARQTPPPADPPAQCMLGYTPPSRRPLLRTVRILLECILV